MAQVRCDIVVYYYYYSLLISPKILGESLYLWSLRFEPSAQIYELWLEETIKIKPDISDKLDALSGFLRFFWTLKVFVTLYCLYE